ncbi:MAG: hypothetical protein K9L59_10060 [Desulfobacterales bacterium]|nr:hypothetical protein [Desulfobacterales bacterium]
MKDHDAQPWLRGKKQIAKYGGFRDPRTAARWLSMGLRHVRVGFEILSRPEWVDEFFLRFEADRRGEADLIVEGIMKEFQG